MSSSGVQRIAFGSSLAYGNVGLAEAAAEVELAVELDEAPVVVGAMMVVLLPVPLFGSDDAGEQLAMTANKSAARAGENPLTIVDCQRTNKLPAPALLK